MSEDKIVGGWRIVSSRGGDGELYKATPVAPGGACGESFVSDVSAGEAEGLAEAWATEYPIERPVVAAEPDPEPELDRADVDPALAPPAPPPPAWQLPDPTDPVLAHTSTTTMSLLPVIETATETKPLLTAAQADNAARLEPVTAKNAPDVLAATTAAAKPMIVLTAEQQARLDKECKQQHRFGPCDPGHCAELERGPMTRLPIVDAARCSACGGECCKRMPGSATPADFPDLDKLETLVRSGYWTLDCWDGDPAFDEESEGVEWLDRVLYPRPAIKGYGGQAHHAAWGGACVFLSSAGCAMSYEDRPEQCRELVPGPQEAGCSLDERLSKQAVALMWRPQAAALEAILARVEADS